MQQFGSQLVDRLRETLPMMLLGIDARTWWGLLRENGFAVDPVYWPRAATITSASVRNLLDSMRESRIYDRLVTDVKVQPPLFILGHARSGTTHLHRLLALDDQFAYPSLYQVVHPHSFLSTEQHRAKQMAWWLPKTRPIDNVSMRVDAPAEDEFVMSVLTRCSPNVRLMFPRHWRRYERYFTFRGVPSGELSRWRTVLNWFLKKVTWKYQRPLVLKSPHHTARIRLLLEMFPGARFVHIHRNPYAVFQSNRRLFSEAGRLLRLQRPDHGDVDDRILNQYTIVYNAFFSDVATIPHGHFCELAFEDLEEDPADQLRQVYCSLGLDGFERFEPKLRLYLESIRGYQKNTYPPLAPTVRRRVAEAWYRSFEAWGYQV